MPLEQFFQRFLLFNSDNAVLLFVGVDAPSEHQFNDITDAAVVAVSNSTNLVNKFFVTDSIETHLVRLGSCNRCCRWFCSFLIDMGCYIPLCIIGTLRNLIVVLIASAIIVRWSAWRT